MVLTGQRRVGKSCLLKQLYAEKSRSANVVYIDKERREFDFIRNYQDLNEYLGQKIKSGEHNFILIDEVQDIEEFERSLRSFRTDPDTDVIVTGSNAKMLSGELSTLIGGRYKEIYIQPLSYTEFIDFHHLKESDETLSLYLNYGGMPGITVTGLNEDEATEYLWDIYHTVLLKDVVMRNTIRNVSFLENLIRFMADNAGKLISANSVCKFMKSQGETVTPTAIINYQKALSDAFLVHKVYRYDIHGKRIFENNDKYYFEDHGIRNAIAGGRREGDIEKVVENVVYQHLVRLGYTVYVGQLQAGEIDFVGVRAGNQKVYVQASYLIADASTREREFGNLAKIRDNYPKYVISATPLVTRNDENGITHLHLRKFLAEGF